MPKLDLIIKIIVVIVLIGILGFAWYSSRDGQLRFGDSEEVTEIETEEGSDQLVEDQADDIADIAADFSELYIEGLTDKDEQAALEAKELLTERGHYVMDAAANPVEGLSRFTRNVPAPDEVVIVSSRKQSENFAEATSTWIYPDRQEERYFYFTLENNTWKIDSIQPVKQ